MSIRQNLFLFFIAATLIPLVGGNWFVISTSQDAVISETFNALQAVARIQEQRLEQTVGRYIEQAQIVAMSAGSYLPASSTQGASYFFSGPQRALLPAIKASAPLIVSIALYDQNGAPVASTENQLSSELLPARIAQNPPTTFRFDEVFKDENNTLRVRLFGPLFHQGKHLGTLEFIMSADPLIAITEDYTGLRNSGEVLLVAKNSAGDGVFLTPLRFDAGAALRRAVPALNTQSVVTRALRGYEGLIFEDKLVDYRDKAVFAVTDFVESVNWALIVKIDRDEVLAPIRAIEVRIIEIAILFYSLAITLWLLVSRVIMRPISKLTVTAQALRGRDFSVRSPLAGTDEIGLLAATFNSMAQELSDFYKNLEGKVAERTQQLAEAKAKDEAVLASIGEGCVVVDASGMIQRMNKAAEELIGFAFADVQGKFFPDVLVMRDAAGRPVATKDRPLSLTLRTGQKMSATNIADPYMYVRPDGTLLPTSITVSPVYYNNELIGAVELFRDITEERALDQAKSDFVTLASHQLRTPLSAVNWFSEMLLEGDMGALTIEQQKGVLEISQSSRRMERLINALLNVSRLEMGGIAIQPSPVNIVKITHEVLLRELKKFPSQTWHVTENYHLAQPVLSYDESLFTIILENLFSNACKYTPPGGSIQVELAPLTDPSRYADQILLTIRDSGYGIPPDQQSKIFTKLFRADNIKDKDTDGTGLGLYIVWMIIKRVGAKIWFESALGKGTTFYIAFPAEGMTAAFGSKKLLSTSE